MVDFFSDLFKAKSPINKGHVSVIAEEEKKAIFQIIDLWVHCFYEIEKRFKYEGIQFDQKDKEAYSLIGESFCYLNQLNSVIASKLYLYLR